MKTVVSKKRENSENRGGSGFRAIMAVLNLPGWILSLFLGRRVRNSIADRGRWWDGLIGPVLFFSFLALIAGLIMPVLRVKKFWKFRDEHISVAHSLFKMWTDEDFMLAALIFTVSVVFPFLKQYEAYRLWRRTSIYDDRFDIRMNRLAWLSKWSMLDVLVVALIVITAKASKFVSATNEPGLYFFTGAIMGTALALTWIGMAATRLRGSGLVQYPE